VLGLFLQPDWFEVLRPGVGTNRFSYSFNDPVNKLDPMGNGAVREFFEAIGRALRSSGDSAARGTINSVAAARARGVEDAWIMEQQLVRREGYGTRRWNDTELEILRNGGRPTGYVGDHITTVAADVTRAADHRNIQFLSEAEHTARHARHGGTRVPIFEDRIVDRTRGGRLPDLATEGARSWPQRSADAIDTVLNSRTFAIIDSVDPASIADRYMQSMGYMGMFESQEAFFLRHCRMDNCT
jgi:GHH signature containing HNH/Endo VII superfamily nuclease toxin